MLKIGGYIQNLLDKIILNLIITFKQRIFGVVFVAALDQSSHPQVRNVCNIGHVLQHMLNP